MEALTDGPPVPRPVRVDVAGQADVEHARRAARQLTHALGGNAVQAEEVALAVAELATNLVRHAHGGWLEVRPVTRARRTGVALECGDQGPGIGDVSRAMQDGFSTRGGLGCGLPMARRLVDDFDISSSPAGTRIRATKWLRRG